MARINGTSAGETLSGGALADQIYGYDGNDTLNGGLGNDYLDGGDGNDTLNGSDGHDAMKGGNGDDTLNGGIGNDAANGGYGNDTLNGNDGNDRLYGDNGNDTMNGGAGLDKIYGSYGSDVASGGDDADYIDGGRDNDNTSTGLSGGNGNDIIYGGLGNDLLNGDAGDDYLVGGVGVDVVNGGSDTKALVGGIYVGGDTMSYADSTFGIVLSLDGSGGATSIDGPALGDTWTGIEHVYGTRYRDILTASATIDGNIYGGDGDDTINAGNSTEMMFGGAGDDVLMGGTAADVDWFVAQYAQGLDRFENFNLNADGDKIIVDKSDFLLGSANVANAAIDASAILVSANFSTATATTRLWFETDTKILWADLDGSGTAYTAKAVAVLDDVATLTTADFWVVA